MERAVLKQKPEGLLEEMNSSKVEILKSKVDPCAKCNKTAMANSVLGTKCGKWVHGGCAEMNRVTLTLEKDFICESVWKQ